jgi:hypothetical protein
MKLPRDAQRWLPGWWAARQRNAAHRFDSSRPITVHLMVGDHYEPYWGRAADDVATARVAAWSNQWPAIASSHLDDDGQAAKWTFFYPEEEYRPDLLDALAALTNAGYGDVEIHLHHDGESEPAFLDRMAGFIDTLRSRHGLLHDWQGRPGFAFIHGNWALDNARPDGRWCGLNNELTLLRRLGCYADFTMPAAPDPCQTSLVNSIYWAVDDPDRPKSHDSGPLVVPGAVPPAEALLCVQGPLTLRAHPKWRVLPSLEVGELAANAPPAPDRAERWLDAAPRIGNDVFVKLFAHGAIERHARPMLGHDIALTLQHMRAACGRRGWRLRYDTAWEMFTAIEVARGATPPS